jgi:hypothetical protein
VFLSGDVHYAYLAEATFPDGPTPTKLYQAVCSPFRQCLERRLERANRIACARGTAAATAILPRLARVPKPPLRWRLRHGPFFDNEVATLELTGREAVVRLERTPPRELRLEHCTETRLS